MTTTKTAVLASGCFWCTEAVFQRLRGVESVTPGYAGGDQDTATYDEIHSGDTGHAECARITFDPAQVSFRDLLEVFFATHDPTTVNRQGNDVGAEYRSIVFYMDDEQRQAAEAIIKELTDEKVFQAPIVTEVRRLDKFYPAEPEQIDFYNKNRNQPYCQFVIAPKLKKFKEKFASLVKDE